MAQTKPTHQKIILEIVDKLLDRLVPERNQENPQEKPSKSKLILLILLSLLVVDYFSRYTENLSIVRKVEHITAINSVVNDPKIDSITKINLIAQERVVSNRHSWQSHFDSLLSRTYNIISSTIENSNIANPANSIKRSNFVHILSSNWALILISLIAQYYILFDKNILFKDKLLILIFFDFSLILTVLAISYLFALIPIFDNPIWNYVLNAILNPLIIFSSVLFFKRMENKGHL